MWLHIAFISNGCLTLQYLFKENGNKYVCVTAKAIMSIIPNGKCTEHGVFCGLPMIKVLIIHVELAIAVHDNSSHIISIAFTGKSPINCHTIP
jgi:hypothetical protein